MLTEENLFGNLTTGHHEVQKLLFSWFDYLIFSSMLGLSVIIGLYFGFFKKQENFLDYFLGGRSMGIFPVAMSLIASEVSGKEFVGIPSDIYTYGVTYWLTTFATILSGLIAYYVYLPVFCNLELANSFEYLKLRFDNKNCLLATFLMVLAWILTMPITLYIPALTLEQVTDINMHVIIFGVSIICTFYTAVGGLRAVVWTDALQFSIMSIAIVFVLIFGCYDVGGIKHIFERSYEGGRIFINFDPDPTNRTAFWSPIIGGTFGTLSFVAASQICVQKFQSLPRFSHIKWAMILFMLGSVLVKYSSTLTGLIIYTRYADCDPISSGIVGNSDQLMPYYIMDVVGKFPGLPGIFIAGIFCAGLSSQSTDLNTLSGLIYKEFMKPYMPEDTTEKRASNIMKILVVVVGFITTVLVYAVMHLGRIYPLLESISSMAAGPLLAMFTLGMLLPIANSKGTFIGAITGLIFMGWIVIGTEIHISQGGIKTPELPVSTEGCDFAVVLNSTISEEDGYVPPWAYRISFYYYTLIGFACTMSVGTIVSLLTGGRYQQISKELLSPVIHFLLPKENKEHEIVYVVQNDTAII